MKILYHHRTRSRDGQSVHIDEMIAALKQQGVSDPVITAMQAHAAPQVYAPPPVVYAPPPQRVIIYERRPPPPPIGVGFHYRGRW